MKSRSWTCLIVLGLLVFVSPRSAHAVGFGKNIADTKPEESSPPTRPDATKRPFFFSESKPSTGDGQLNSCQSRLGAVKNRSNSLVKMANEMLGRFESIALSVQSFYTTKVVPGGSTLPNYQTLVSDIASKKAIVEKSLSAATTDVSAFSCDNGDIKALFAKFGQDMRKVQSGLHDYRTSIKNLIVAVRSLAKPEESSRPLRSAKPSGSPKTFSPRPSSFPIRTYTPKPYRSPIPFVTPIPGTDPFTTNE